MKCVFAGTPDFAATILQDLLTSEHNIIAVYTQPDRPKGRGRKLTKSPVKLLAEEHGLPIFQPDTLKNDTQLAVIKPDIMIVVAYGLLLPSKILAVPRHGCINVHASLLPKWRGAAPIQRAIEAGDNTTGVTIMQMDAGLDTGMMLSTLNCPITDDDTATSLHDKLAPLGSKALITTLDQIETDNTHKITQDDSLANYAHKLTKQEAKLNWQESAITLNRKIRAFNPQPGAFSLHQDIPVKIWESTALAEKTSAPPGTIIKADKNGIDVATGDNTLRLLILQRPGGKALPARDIINAKNNTLQTNTRFTS